jgi:hypothetical protein
MLKTYPNINLSITMQLDENQQGTRHLKHGRHITLNPWKRAQPMLIYSDQIIMIHEFQMAFNELWVGLSSGTRENTISLLDRMIEEIERIQNRRSRLCRQKIILKVTKGELAGKEFIYDSKEQLFIGRQGIVHCSARQIHIPLSLYVGGHSPDVTVRISEVSTEPT